MFSLPLTPEEPCCGSPCRGATGEGAVWDSQTSSVYWRCYDKVLFSLTIRTLCEQPRNTLSFGVSPMSVTLPLPNMGQGTLSAFPVVMHLGVALRSLAPSCTAHTERNVAGEPREHMPRTGSVMLSSRMRNSMEEKRPLAEPACFHSGSLSILLHQIRVWAVQVPFSWFICTINMAELKVWRVVGRSDFPSSPISFLGVFRSEPPPSGIHLPWVLWF